MSVCTRLYLTMHMSFYSDTLSWFRRSIQTFGLSSEAGNINFIVLIQTYFCDQICLLLMWKVCGLNSYIDSGLLQLAWPQWLLILSTHNPNSIVMESTNEVCQQFMDTHGHTCRNHDNRECLYLSSMSSVIDNHNKT